MTYVWMDVNELGLLRSATISVPFADLVRGPRFD
jgi:hypothetical protein